MKNLKVKNGKVSYKDKEWYVDRTKPMTLQSAFGSNRPLYLLKWNTVIPMDFDVTNKTTTLVNPKTGENLLLKEKNLKIETKYAAFASCVENSESITLP